MFDALLLADEFFFAAHDDRTGKPRQHLRAIGLGLAGGLLGELVLFKRVSIERGVVTVINRHPPEDALAHTVLDHLLGESQPHSPRTWLAFLAQNSYERVAARMERCGLVSRVQSRRLWKTDTHWVAVNDQVAAWPATRLRHLLVNEKPLERPDIVLAGLVEATDLSDAVLWGAGSRTLQYRDYLLSTLTEPLRELIAETTAAVDSAVLTART